MNYLTLSRQEIRELLQIRLRDFFIYAVALILLPFVYQKVVLLVVPQISGADLFMAVLLFITAFLMYLWYINKRYFFELLVSRQKRIYMGVLANKSVYKLPVGSKFSFNMDGYIFYVNEETYNRFQEGDFLEFHISPSTKHLFKVEKAK